MPIHLRENQYAGVNAHLQSMMLRRSWRGFHTMHIAHLTEALQRLLPPESGYLVMPEESLQLARYDPDEEAPTVSHNVPDVNVYKTGQPPRAMRALLSPAAATIAVASTLVTPEPDQPTAVMIYQAQQDSLLGTPVTRIELLSPANKPPGSYARDYALKRTHTLQAGIRLVEIDYFHQRRSPAAAVPSYPDRQPGAYPYLILISDPLPTVENGLTYLYGFRVDEPIVPLRIPLMGTDTVTLDFGAVYNHTFVSNPVYGLRFVDYSLLPEDFESYHPDDQARIRALMAAVAARVNAE
jgi:hypothetical protein